MMGNEDVAVRLANMGDAEVIAGFNVEMAWETEEVRLDPVLGLAGVRAALGDVHKAIYFLAEVGGVVAGQVMVTHEWSDWRNGDIWWVQSVYVTPGFRRRGVFGRMYRHVVAAAKEAGAVGVRLYVEKENAEAQRTYVSMGMEMTYYVVMQEIFGKG
ncbi:MAG TPA: GNAT family N-acetyltransferase [Tepidisphaeraceae bacterium]|jgi:ribosomal protein S18 acetylase RimI-like enzyme|nr:GNAT family N-acetyltransferase [Tepidisphaeraceae bacterium]